VSRSQPPAVEPLQAVESVCDRDVARGPLRWVAAEVQALEPRRRKAPRAVVAVGAGGGAGGAAGEGGGQLLDRELAAVEVEAAQRGEGLE
jgi:hypothetical protein